jgi:poly(A) polymerase
LIPNGKRFAKIYSPSDMSEGTSDLSDNDENHYRDEHEDRREHDAPREHEGAPLPGSPLVLHREDHGISRKDIDRDALKVMYRLIQHGYTAFLVGGGVRDLLLRKLPKDFDIGTDAKPEDVRALFRNSRIIGRRFRLTHVFFGGNKILEVATFRASSEDDEESRGDNTFGDPQTDALRRDLTINGLFYDPSNFTVIDYCGGIADLRAGIVRIIGDPEVRFKEDPVRMMRAVRHAARTGFKIEEKTYSAILENAELISSVSKARVHEELLKDLSGGCLLESFKLFEATGLLRYLMPQLDNKLGSQSTEETERLHRTLQRIDRMKDSNQDLSPAVLFLATHLDLIQDDCVGDHAKMKKLTSDLFSSFGVTRREKEQMEHILMTAFQLFEAVGNEKRARKLLEKMYFRESLTLIELTSANRMGKECVEYWSGLRRGHHGAPRHRRRRP